MDCTKALQICKVRNRLPNNLDPVYTRTDPKWYGSISDPYHFLLVFTLDRIQISTRLHWELNWNSSTQIRGLRGGCKGIH